MDRQKEAYQQMKARISHLEEELKSAPQISPKEKIELEQALARAISNKDSAVKEKEAALLAKELAIREKNMAFQERDTAIQDKDRVVIVSDITRSDLNKATEEITTLTMEKRKFSEQISSLKSLIRTIEKEKADNFSTGLVLARLHTEGFPG